MSAATRLFSLASATTILSLGLSHASTTVLISDTFTTATEGSLAGRTPDQTFGGKAWLAPAGTSLSLSGTGHINSDYSSSWAGFDLGIGYITSNPGIYELSVTISNVSASNTSWLGVGFSSAGAVTSNTNLVGNAGQPWMFQRANGQITVYGTQAVAEPTSVLNSTISGISAGSPWVFKIILDASDPANMTFTASVNGTLLDLNGSANPGFAFDPATNPTIRYVGISGTTNGTSPGVGTFDNFELTFTPVPEPSAALLGLLAAPFILRRRRA